MDKNPSFVLDHSHSQLTHQVLFNIQSLLAKQGLSKI